MSPFLFFSNEKRSQVQAENPDLKITEVSAKLGEIWRQMSEQEKLPYVEKSKTDRDRYKTQQSEFKGKNPQLTTVPTCDCSHVVQTQSICSCISSRIHSVEYVYPRQFFKCHLLQCI